MPLPDGVVFTRYDGDRTIFFTDRNGMLFRFDTGQRRAAGWGPWGRDGRFAAHGSRFFAARWGTPRPCKRFAVFAAAGVCVVDCTPTNGTPFSLYNGVRVCCRYAIRFFVPLALPLIPGSPLPISICASS